MKQGLVFLLLLFCVSGAFAATGKAAYQFESMQQHQRFYHLIGKYRCLVCQNENLADSTASLAKDLRDQVYHMVRTGKTNPQITKYLVSRYGDFVLYEPPLQKNTWFLWFAPIGLLIFFIGS